MKSLKKTTSILLILVMVLGAAAALTGCGGGDDTANDSGWAYIEDKGELVIGLDDTFAPMGFRDENNELVGFDIDLANAVGEQLGVAVKFQPIEWDAKEMELSSKNIDCIWNGLTITEERAAAMSIWSPKAVPNSSLKVLKFSKSQTASKYSWSGWVSIMSCISRRKAFLV